MIVVLRRPFWDGEKLYPQSLDGIEIDDKWKDALPKTATILSADEAKTKRKRTKAEKEVEEAALPRTLSELARAQAPMPKE